ncbi:MAG: hypothetical protein ACLP5H_32185 [Desulfomonilaceae bacterium]
MDRGVRILVMVLRAAVCLSSYPLCFRAEAQNRAYPERVLLIENCDDYQRCLDSCAELVKSFGTAEITREEAKSRLDRVAKEVPAIIMRDLHLPADTGKKFSVENQVHGKLRENIYMWTLFKTMYRSRVPGGPPKDPRADQEIKAKENSLKGACPNIVIPQVR